MEKLSIDEIKKLVNEKNYSVLKSYLSSIKEMDAAELISSLDEEMITPVFRLLPKDIAADIFANFDSDVQGLIISRFTDKESAALIEEQMVDDAVDVLEELPANVVKRILMNVTADMRKDINQFLSYPDESVGSVMTAEFINIKKNMTVHQALLRVRKNASEVEDVYSCYVTDDKMVLEGVVKLKDLLVSGDDEIVEDIMDKDVVYSNTHDDRENAARLVKKYDLLSLPVVDKENRLVGIVTVDDIIDVLEDEVTEDIEKMAAVLPNDEEYLKTSVFKLARNRVVWLAFLMVASVFSQLIIRSKDSILVNLGLAAFMPMLTDTGGNAGSQTASIMIRSMAVGEIKMSDFFRTFWKEFRVAFIVAIIMGVLAFVRIILPPVLLPGVFEVIDKKLCLAISTSIFFTIMFAKIIGCSLPFLAKFLHIDPALMASPVISTIMDAVTLLVYFFICSKFMNF